MQLHEMEIDIIGVAETFLNKDITPAEINIEGYTMFKKDRCNFKEGRAGGIIRYIRNEIMSYDAKDFNISQSESVWSKIKINNKSLVTIGVCYKSQAAPDYELRELFKVIE